MPRRLTVPPPVPDLYRRLPPDARLSTREAAQLLGVTPETIWARVRDGHMPKPTDVRPTRNPARTAFFWRVGVILAYIDGLANRSQGVPKCKQSSLP